MTKTLQEQNLTDNFLFWAMMDHKVYGPIFAQTVLEPLLQREVRIRSIKTEKMIPPQKPGLHAIRLDAYIQEDAVDVSRGEVFDLEPENKSKDKESLPKRSRYYHSRIDGKVLQSMRPYKDLPRCWVIFITTFDPFDENRMVYTIRNRCVEEPGMEYDDGAVTLFLYVHGEPRDTPAEVRELLCYLSDTTSKNACSVKLKKLHSCVELIRQDPEIREAYMDWEEYIEYERMEAREEAEKRIREVEAERDAAVTERDVAMEERDAAVTERDVAMEERDAAVTERHALIVKIEELTARMEKAGLLSSAGGEDNEIMK